jgi:hypothetical protein
MIVKFKYGNKNGGLGLKMGRHSAYPKILQVPPDSVCPMFMGKSPKSCEGFN